jgi:hypothetical protein
VKAYAAAQTPVSARILLKMSGANRTGIVDKPVYANFMESLGMDRAVAEAAYNDIEDALVSSSDEEEGDGGEA